MIDCSRTENYLKEKARMLKSVDGCECTIPCADCPLNAKNNGLGVGCHGFESFHSGEAITIVQKWSNEHPLKRYKDDFFEKFPNATKQQNGRPASCRNLIYGIKAAPCIATNGKTCADCWDEVMPETE